MDEKTWLSELTLLQERRGDRAVRGLARETGLAANTIRRVLAGEYVPPLRTLLPIVEVLGGDREVFIELWRAAKPPTDDRDLLETIYAEVREIHRLLERLLREVPVPPVMEELPHDVRLSHVPAARARLPRLGRWRRD